MRVYYYFRDRQGWFKENYTMQGHLYWTRTEDIKQAYRTDSYWLYQKLIKKELANSFYCIEERDHYQKLT